jgi:hypothetical protein
VALLTTAQRLATPETQFVFDNIMWMNEAKLVQNMRGPEREYVPLPELYHRCTRAVPSLYPRSTLNSTLAAAPAAPYGPRIRLIAIADPPPLPPAHPLCLQRTITPCSRRGFVGMVSAIDLWNAEAQRVLEGTQHPFNTVDMNTLSVTMQSLILRDCVHFKAPVYAVQATIHLNIIFRDTPFCF